MCIEQLEKYLTAMEWYYFVKRFLFFFNPSCGSRQCGIISKDAGDEQTVILVCYEEDQLYLPKHHKNHFLAFVSVAYIT